MKLLELQSDYSPSCQRNTISPFEDLQYVSDNLNNEAAHEGHKERRGGWVLLWGVRVRGEENVRFRDEVC